jgi:hypothetical protein
MRSDLDCAVRDRVLWVVVALSTGLRAFFAWRFFGFLGGDDVEVLEEAFRRAIGLAYAPWHIRNLFVPDLLVAPVVRLGLASGVRETGALAFLATVPFVLLASVNVILVYRLARFWGRERTVARTAAAIYAFHWLPLAFGSTVYPRTAATTCILLAAVWVSESGRDLARGLAAGAVVSIAFAERYSEGLFLLPLLLLGLSVGGGRKESLRRSLGLVGSFALGAGVTVGIYDLLTWGDPFASLIAFAKLTLVERAFSSRVAVQSPLFYLERLLYWLPPTLLPALPLSWKDRSLRPAWAFLLVPVGILSLVHHKELRYLQGAIPFLAILGAAGLTALRSRWRPSVVTGLLALTFASEVLGVRVLAGKSMAAVAAARVMASDRSVKVVVLSQAWAYGDRLYFGNRVEVRDLPTPPIMTDLEEKIAGADRVALYRKDLTANPALAAVLARYGFTSETRFQWGESKSVAVFSRN